MKKLTSLTLALLLCLTLFGCAGNPTAPSAAGSQPVSSAPASSAPASSAQESSTAENSTAQESSVPASSTNTAGSPRVAALKGPTAMGMVQMMENSAGEYTIAASADEITPKLIQGDYDIAAVPANLASVLYSKTQGGVQVLAVNTLGVLYIVENGDTVHSVEDLKGKTIYSAGKGATPEYALNYMLTQNGIDPEQDVTIEWKSEHSECVAALASGENAVAMLPQPFVTTAQAKNEAIRVALDLNEEWEKLSSTGEEKATLITGVVVARKAFIEQEPETVKEFLTAYEQSVSFVNTDIDGAAALIGKYDIVPEAVAKKALPECNITFIAGSELKEKLSGYLQTLFDQNPKAIGGAMPGDDFYYAG